MKKSEAVFHLRVMMHIVQRFRSIMDETGTIVMNGKDADFPHITEYIASKMWPFIWGEKCILPNMLKPDEVGVVYGVFNVDKNNPPEGGTIVDDPDNDELFWAFFDDLESALACAMENT